MCRHDQHTRIRQPTCSRIWINLILEGAVPGDVTLQPATENKEHYVPGCRTKMSSPSTKSILSTKLWAADLFFWTNSSKTAISPLWNNNLKKYVKFTGTALIWRSAEVAEGCWPLRASDGAACGEEAVPLGLESVIIATPPVHSGARTTAWQTAITWAGSVFIWSHKSKLRLGLALFGSCLIRSKLWLAVFERAFQQVNQFTLSYIVQFELAKNIPCVRNDASALNCQALRLLTNVHRTKIDQFNPQDPDLEWYLMPQSRFKQMELTGGSSWFCASDADLYWLPVCTGPANWKPHHDTAVTTSWVFI